MIEKKSYFDSSGLTWDLIAESSTSQSSSNEKVIILINKDGGLAPYSHSFIEEIQDPQILSGFVSAMSSFMAEMIGEQNSTWKTVYGSDSILIVEGGDWIIGALIASRETNEARSKLRSIIREFEDSFAVFKHAEGVESSVFVEFDEFVRRVFVDERITRRTQVIKLSHWRSSLDRFRFPSTAFTISKILLGFEEIESIENIAKFQDLSIREVMKHISMAYWQGIVKLKFLPADNDILALSEKAASQIFKKKNPLELFGETLQVIAKLDGRIPLSDITKDMIIQDQELLLSELGRLINNGLVQRISVEKRLVLLYESILSNLIDKGSSWRRKGEMIQTFQEICDEGRLHQPRISRVILHNSTEIKCILEDNMSPADLDDMCDALEYLINKIEEYFFEVYGKRIADKYIQEARRASNQIWAPYLENVAI